MCDYTIFWRALFCRLRRDLTSIRTTVFSAPISHPSLYSFISRMDLYCCDRCIGFSLLVSQWRYHPFFSIDKTVIPATQFHISFHEFAIITPTKEWVTIFHSPLPTETMISVLLRQKNPSRSSKVHRFHWLSVQHHASSSSRWINLRLHIRMKLIEHRMFARVQKFSTGQTPWFHIVVPTLFHHVVESQNWQNLPFHQ